MSTDVSLDPFGKLPDDILLKVFRNLSDFDLTNVRKVCKRFESVSKDRMLVRHIDLCGCYAISSTTLVTYLRPVAHHVESLNLNNCYWLSPLCCDTIMRCRGLVSLHLLHLSISMSRLIALLARLRNLQHLSVTLSNVREFQSLLDLNPEAQATMRGVRVLTVQVKQRPVRSSAMTMQFVAVTSFFEYCSSLQEFHVQGSFRSNGIPPQMVSPQIKQLQNLQHVHTMTVTDAIDPLARMFFFGTLLEVCKLPELWFRTLLLPMVVNEHLSRKDDYTACIGRIQQLQHLDISQTNAVIPNQVYQLERAHQLTYLNVADNSLIDCGSLQVLADSCPHLTSLNLRNCHHLYKKCDAQEGWQVDVSGLRCVVMNCTALRHLNVSGVHIHGRDLLQTGYPSICRLLALNPKWRSLSLSPCSLCPGSRDDSDVPHGKRAMPAEPTPLQGPLTKRRRCGMQGPDMSVDVEVELSTELGGLVKACPHVEHFELIGAGFRSSFSKRYKAESMRHFTSCCTGMKMEEADLVCIRRWKRLHTLQLSGVPAIQHGDSLSGALSQCPRLQRLLVAQLCYTPLPLYQDSMLSALPNAHRLTDLRIEQCRFHLRDSVWRALSGMTSLQRLCIMCKYSTFDPAHVMRFVEQVPSLVVLQLFVSNTMTIKACSQLQTKLVTTLKEQRPALSVCIFPLIKDMYETPLHLIPDIHLENITILSSSVCLTPHLPYTTPR